MISLNFLKVLFCALVLSGSVVGCGTTQEIGKEEKSEEDIRKATRHFVEGSLYEMQGNYRGAVEEYKKALQYDENAAIYHSLAKAYDALGNLDDALSEAERAVDLDGLRREYREELAYIYTRRDDFEKAIAQYKKIIEIDRNYIDAYYSLARLYRMSEPLRSLEIYEEIINRFGPHREALFQMVEIYHSLERYDDAIVIISALLDIDPGNHMLKVLLGTTYFRTEKYEEAREAFLELHELYPEDLEILTYLVDSYMALKDYEAASGYIIDVIRNETLPLQTKIHIGEIYFAQSEIDSSIVKIAIDIFEEIKTLYPEDHTAFWYRGAIAYMNNDYDTALDNFEAVMQLDPGNTDAVAYKGEIYFQKGDYSAVINLINPFIDEYGSDYYLVFLTGMSYNRLNELDKAAVFLEIAIQLEPENLGGLSMLALTYDSMENFEKSDSLYEVALQMDSENPLVLNNYSYSLAERNEQLERALEMSKRAVAMDPENSSYLDTLGWIYFQLGDYEQAKVYVHKAIELGTESAVINDHMGDIYYRLGDRERATHYWEKALELDETKDKVRDKINRGSL